MCTRRMSTRRKCTRQNVTDPYKDINYPKCACSQAKILYLRTDDFKADLFNRDQERNCQNFLFFQII